MAGSVLSVEEVRTPFGVVEVAAGPDGIAWVRLPAAPLPPRQVVVAVNGDRGEAEALAREAAGQLAEYFDGERRAFDLPLDLSGLPEFQRLVLEAAGEIPFGETASYREMAQEAGRPEAVRAAGTAMGANPVPILIPCHRVIRSDGTPGMYGGGEAMKIGLLEFERAEVAVAAR